MPPMVDVDTDVLTDEPFCNAAAASVDDGVAIPVDIPGERDTPVNVELATETLDDEPEYNAANRMLADAREVELFEVPEVCIDPIKEAIAVDVDIEELVWLDVALNVPFAVDVEETTPVWPLGFGISSTLKEIQLPDVPPTFRVVA